MEFEGAGAGDTLGFELVTGTAAFRLRHDGASEFLVNLVDSKGQRHANLAKTQGFYDGSKTAHITLAGTYAMKVFADGNWTISVEQ